METMTATGDKELAVVTDLTSQIDDLLAQAAALKKRREKAVADAYVAGAMRTEICREAKISETTLSKYLRENNVKIGNQNRAYAR